MQQTVNNKNRIKGEFDIINQGHFEGQSNLFLFLLMREIEKLAE